jgi:hypothetical protein
MAVKPGIRGLRASDKSVNIAETHTFRSPTALVVWVVWLLFAVGNWVDLAVQGRDHLSVVAAAILLLATGVAYACAQRPRVIADPDGLTIRNPLRDHRISWAAVADVDLVDLLRVHCDWGPPGAEPETGAKTGAKQTDAKKHRKVISAWAVHYSRRRQFSAEAKARRAASPRRSPLSLGGMGIPSYGTRGLSSSTPGSAPEAEAEHVARVLREHATAARAETVWAQGTVPLAPTPPTPAAPTSAPAVTSTAEATPSAEAASAPQGAPVSATASTGALTGWAEPPQSTWNRTALAAILIPALILLIVCLL